MQLWKRFSSLTIDKLLTLGPNAKLVDSRNRVVSVTDATITITKEKHEGRIIKLDRAAGITATLPDAKGKGDKYVFLVGTTVTSNNDIIQAASGSDEFVGELIGIDTDTSDTLAAYPALDGDGFDTVTMNGSTKGGIQGDLIEITDVAVGKFHITGCVRGTGTVADPFSAAVS